MTSGGARNREMSRRKGFSWPRTRILLAVGAGGAIGAGLRYEVALALPTRPGTFPLSTFVINISGSFALGVLLCFLAECWRPSEYPRPLVGSGVIGAYTTWSTFMVEADQLFQHGHALTGIAYLTGSLFSGLAAVWAGVAIARIRWGHRARRPMRQVQQVQPDQQVERPAVSQPALVSSRSGPSPAPGAPSAAGAQRHERLSILMTEADRHGRVPLYVELIDRARRAGLAGATAIAGEQGFGHLSRPHTRSVVRSADDIPIEVMVIDSTQRIEEFIPEIADLLAGRVVVRREVQVVSDRSPVRKARKP